MSQLTLKEFMTTLLSWLRSSRENVWFYRLDIGKAVEWIDWCVSKCQTADQILHALSLRNKTCAQSARLRPRWRNNDEQQLPRTSGCSGTLAPFFLFPLIIIVSRQGNLEIGGINIFFFLRYVRYVFSLARCFLNTKTYVLTNPLSRWNCLYIYPLSLLN